MPPFRLNIAEPCPADWNEMTGSEKRRHCASCDKDVVALAEMTPDDAVALVRSAKPHSLCLRIEHDDDGAVVFRNNAAQTRTMPLSNTWGSESPSALSAPNPILMLAIGASMLVTACNEAKTISSAPSADKTISAESVAAPESTAEKTNSPIAITPVVEKAVHASPQTASSAEVHSPAGANDRLAKPQHTRATRVTTGCVCAVGDKLCDCL
jgi:hypothetical protein